MKTLLKCLVLALVAGLVFYGFDAAAAGTSDNTLFRNAANVMIRTFKNVRVIVYIIGAFGLIGIAIGGIVGKINFKWLGYLAAGLAIVAVADWVISYVAKVRSSGTEVSTTAIKWSDVESGMNDNR